MLFLGYMTLVLKHPEKQRGFNIPGGNVVKLLVASCGFLLPLLAFMVSFFPRSGLPSGESSESYVGLLVVSFLVVVVIPFIVYELHGNRPAQRVHVKQDNAPEGHFAIHLRGRGSHILVPLDAHEDKA